MECDEPHLTLNEKMQPIKWTEWPTGALVAVGSLWLGGLGFEPLCRDARRSCKTFITKNMAKSFFIFLKNWKTLKTKFRSFLQNYVKLKKMV